MSMVGSSPSGFAPGRHNHGVSKAPEFPDAADALFHKSSLPQRASGEGILLLADGGRLRAHFSVLKGLGKVNLFLPLE